MKRSFLAAALICSTLITVAQNTVTTTLMPLPAKMEMKSGTLLLTSSFAIAIKCEAGDTVLTQAANRFCQSLNRRTGLYFNQQFVKSNAGPDGAILLLTSGTKSVATTDLDESYTLNIGANNIELVARNTEGCLHGLETILQLVYNDHGNYYLPQLSIQDAPRFGWRGLMLDVARHFMPVDAIERNIDAMAAVKLNVLHLHLADDEGFRVESKTFPDLTEKGSNGEFYTQSEIRHLISYARARGIMVLPEFDMPGHTTSWFAGYPAIASAPGPYEPGPRFKGLTSTSNLGEIMKMINTTPTATMDPSKEATYKFLDKFFAEMSGLFPSEYIHIGCDENNGVAWTTNPSIVAFMKQQGIADAHALQAYFSERVRKILTKYNRKTIGWEEIISKGGSKDLTVQVWSDASYVKKAATNGNRMIISRGFYLDLFMPASIHYNNELLLSADSSHLIAGGEAALWSEAVDRRNLETRAWPRAAAVAERLWSNASVRDVDDMYRRLAAINILLDENGLQQMTNYGRSLRRMTGGAEIGPLKTLTDVLVPIKGYKKMFSRIGKPAAQLYQTAPLVEVSDIIPVESDTRRKFREMVSSYLKNKNTVVENQIRNELIRWRDNSTKLQPYFDMSEFIAAVKAHSDNLHESALIGLEALDRLASSAPASPEWNARKLATLKEFRKSHAETELDIVAEIESLVTGQLVAEPTSYPMF